MLETIKITYNAPTRSMFSLKKWDIVEVAGADRASFLAGLLSNEVKKLPLGGGNTAFTLTAKGRITHELIVGNLPNRIVLLTSPNCGKKLQEDLDYYHFTEDIKLSLASDLEPLLLYGTNLPNWFTEKSQEALLLPNTGKNIGSFFSTETHKIETLWVTNIPVLQEMPSLLIWLPVGQSKTIQETLSSENFQHSTPTQWENHRAWYKWHDAETVLKDRLVHEVGCEHSHISYTKGCFVGQEVVARTEHRGKANQQIVIVQPASLSNADSQLSSQQAITDESGKEVGTILQQMLITEDKIGYESLIKIKAIEQKKGLFVQLSETKQVPLKQVIFEQNK